MLTTFAAGQRRMLFLVFAQAVNSIPVQVRCFVITPVISLTGTEEDSSASG